MASQIIAKGKLGYTRDRHWRYYFTVDKKNIGNILTPCLGKTITISVEEEEEERETAYRLTPAFAGA